MIATIHYIREERTIYATAGICRRRVVLVFDGLFLAVWLAGCQSLAQRDGGPMVPDFNRVAIPSEGTSSHTINTSDMTVTYQCRRAGDKLKIWGSGKIRHETVNELVFQLYFLDAQGRVISVHDFYSFADQQDFDILKFTMPFFERDRAIPAGAVAFAIGYEGTTMGSKPEPEISFSHYPFG